jgi:uncharacterized membrane protein
MREFLKTTLIGGLLVVLPVGIVVVLVLRSVVTVREALTPVIAHLHLPTLFPGLLAGLIVLAVCFVTGLVVQTRIGKRIGLALEQGMLERLPGYVLLKSLSQRAVAGAEGTSVAPALFETDDGLLPAFVVEWHQGGTCTVFVPAVPTPAVGALYIAPQEKVHTVDVPVKKLVQCVTQWGVGSEALLKPTHGGDADSRSSAG